MLLPLMVTVQLVVVVPWQFEDQPLNFDPGAGAAVSVTGAPSGKLKLHVEPVGPQLIVPGELVTVP